MAPITRTNRKLKIRMRLRPTKEFEGADIISSPFSRRGHTIRDGRLSGERGPVVSVRSRSYFRVRLLPLTLTVPSIASLATRIPGPTCASSSMKIIPLSLNTRSSLRSVLDIILPSASYRETVFLSTPVFVASSRTVQPNAALAMRSWIACIIALDSAPICIQCML